MSIQWLRASIGPVRGSGASEISSFEIPFCLLGYAELLDLSVATREVLGLLIPSSVLEKS